MPPIAVPKSAELFNRLADLDLGDHDAAMGMLFELRGLVRSRPGDPTAQVGLSEACIIVGYRKEALQHLAIADRLWNVANLPAKVRIAALYGSLGNQGRALLRAKELFEQRTQVQASTIAVNAAVSARRYGDLEFLGHIHSWEQEMQLPQRAGKILREINDLELQGCFPAIQDAVSELVAPYAMGFAFDTSVHPDDGRPFLSMSIKVDTSLIHSIDLGNDVSDRLDALAQERDDMPADWWWRYIVTVDSAPRHPSIPAAPRRRQAA